LGLFTTEVDLMGIYSNYPDSIYDNGAGGGGGNVEVYLQAIVPVPGGKVLVVDENGYIGSESLPTFYPSAYTSYAFVVSGADFSGEGLGQVTLIEPGTADIGGRSYRTVTINGVTWTAENLDFKASGVNIGPSGMPGIPAAWYYNNDENIYGVNGNKYGLLYNWHAVKYLDDNRDVLMPGWHVPTRSEFDALGIAVGGVSVAGTMLKSSTGWNSGNGTDDFGFSAFPAGRRADGTFSSLGTLARFWVISEDTSVAASTYYFTDTSAQMSSGSSNKTDYAFSMRLVKDP
jgi:uncharacterized protein (TIGR02145 family)